MDGGRDVPRRRILFLGCRSFELEEEGVDLIGRRQRLSFAIMRYNGAVRSFGGPRGNQVV
ncbi:hypothetical protein CsSME_00023632 [Camellia sinensis var. sinensis]